MNQTRPPTVAEAGTAPLKTATLVSAVVLPMFLAMIDQTSVASALERIGSGLGSFDGIALVIAVYLAAAAIFAPVFGRLGDAKGRRRMMCVAIMVTLAGSTISATAPTFEILVAGRFVQGVGGGGMLTLSYALVAQSLPPRLLASVQGYLATVGIVASTLGPTVGGLLTESFGWRYIFWLNVPVALLALVMIFRLPPRRSPRRPLRFDWAGLLLLAAGVAALLAWLEKMRVGDAASATRIILAGIVISAFIALVLLQRKLADPLFPPALFRNPAISCSLLLAAWHGAIYVTLFTFTPLYFALAGDRSPAEAGIMMIPLAIGVGSGSLIAGLLMSRTGRTTMLAAIGLAGSMTTMVWLFIEAGDLADSVMLAAFTLTALLIGPVMSVANITTQLEAERPMLGIATATVSLSRSIGGALGASLAGSMLVSGLAAAPAQQSQAFAPVFGLIAFFAAAGCVTALLIPRRFIDQNRV